MWNSNLSRNIKVSFFRRVSFKVHDSQPYRSTDSTVAWKKLTLMPRERLEFHPLFRPFRALQARAFLILISCSVELTQEPRYLKSLTSFSAIHSVVLRGG